MIVAMSLECPLCLSTDLDRPPVSPVGVCERHARLIHTASLVVGRVKKVHPPGAWKADGEARPVTAAVIEMQSGDAFVAAPSSAFVPLSEDDLILYERAVAAIGTALLGVLKQTPPPTSPADSIRMQTLVRAALSSALRRASVG